MDRYCNQKRDVLYAMKLHQMYSLATTWGSGYKQQRRMSRTEECPWLPSARKSPVSFLLFSRPSCSVTSIFAFYCSFLEMFFPTHIFKHNYTSLFLALSICAYCLFFSSGCTRKSIYDYPGTHKHKHLREQDQPSLTCSGNRIVILEEASISSPVQ